VYKIFIKHAVKAGLFSHVSYLTSTSAVSNKPHKHRICIFLLKRITATVVPLLLPCDLQDSLSIVHYRAMHYGAKCGLAIACLLSVCPSVCDVGGSAPHILETNCGNN